MDSRSGKTAYRRLPTARRPVSPLTLRILAVNVLALAILMGSLLYLGRYQDKLIESEQVALRAEARIFASALGEGAVIEGLDEIHRLSPDLARRMLRRLVETTETRTRLFMPDGKLVSDSRFLLGRMGMVQVRELPPPTKETMSGKMHKILRGLAGLFEHRRHSLYRENTPQTAQDYPEVQSALDGDPEMVVRNLPEGGLILSVAVPVQRYKQVLGAVMLTRNGARIEASLASVRSDILKIFSVSLMITVLLSLYLAGTIARPLLRLAHAAEIVRQGSMRDLRRTGSIPDLTRRHDEIGDLSAALRSMTDALVQRMDAIEHFAADVAHEIKNPLTSVRSAVETALKLDDPARQRQLLAIIADDVNRLDRLISDISNASRLDAELSRAESEPVSLVQMLGALPDLYRSVLERPHAPVLVVDMPSDQNDWRVWGMEGRLMQVLRNLIDNALSFSPPGQEVRVRVEQDEDGDHLRLTVEDRGPGIPENKLDSIFDRFYSERPAGEKFGTHSGLGLSIVRQIVIAHRGTVFAHNRSDGPGSVFTVVLPRLV
ncbi:MAG: stimulus-sensing domain-containing protein [Alphaproteobacteria bacterium]|nr:MAG: stimulus-sensing domain-containing protein [Alphaproteobacteria bacterium]